MSQYTPTTNFTVKDNLPSGNPAKIIKGSEINTEYTNIQTAVNSKSDSASPTFTGTVTTPAITVTGTATIGTIDGGSY